IALRASSLDWTILRPGLLTDEPPTGLVALGADLPRGSVTRADVAAVLAAVVERDDTIGRQWNLIGGNVSVSAAIDEAIRG
ncbi:NAD(P)H-binding protein, partial [Nocardioides sp. GCM10030258]|uniref:NAD(P)H-binding protein n=1 Tax=unclassified Nocardioides TaxID=2615069 RepID=UPI003622B443